MNKRNRIKKNEEFQEVFKRGNSMANRQFVIYQLDKPNQEHFRIGLSVSKKVGNAVTRNQIKRYIRQVFQEIYDQLDQSKDYIVIARMPAATMDFHSTKKSLLHVLKKANVLQNGKIRVYSKNNK